MCLFFCLYLLNFKCSKQSAVWISELGEWERARTHAVITQRQRARLVALYWVAAAAPSGPSAAAGPPARRP